MHDKCKGHSKGQIKFISDQYVLLPFQVSFDPHLIQWYLEHWIGVPWVFGKFWALLDNIPEENLAWQKKNVITKKRHLTIASLCQFCSISLHYHLLSPRFGEVTPRMCYSSCDSRGVLLFGYSWQSSPSVFLPFTRLHFPHHVKCISLSLRSCGKLAAVYSTEALQQLLVGNSVLYSSPWSNRSPTALTYKYKKYRHIYKSANIQIQIQFQNVQSMMMKHSHD